MPRRRILSLAVAALLAIRPTAGDPATELKVGLRRRRLVPHWRSQVRGFG